jgi:hemerythrin-like domain-containing protein
MLHSIGTKRSHKHDDRSLLGRLLDCHARILEMLALARRVSEEPRPPDGEIAEAADRVRRYFKRALAQHVRDEEESILPRLASAGVAKEALERMRQEHQAHDPLVASLVAACEELRDAPARWEDLRSRVRAGADGLEAVMRVHLEEEERDVFPLLATALDEAAREQIVVEMQARRDADGGGGGGRGRGRQP